MTRPASVSLLVFLLQLCLSCAQVAEAPTVAEEPAPPVPVADGTAGGPFVVVLGTAQDGGIPHAGCDGPRCAAAHRDPALRRRVASLGLVIPGAGEDGGAATYLLDATPDLVDQLESLRRAAGEAPVGGVDRSPLSGVFLTHAHMGHYLGLAHFGFEAVHTRDLPVWGTPRMLDFLRDNAPWEQLVSLGNVDLRPLWEGDSPSLAVPAPAVELGGGAAAGGLDVRALPVPHRDEYTDTVAFLVHGPERTLLYVPDTDGWDAWPLSVEQVMDEAGVDVALLDGTFYSLNELPGRSLEQVRHPLISRSMERFAPLLEAGNVQICFTHLNHSNPAVDREASEYEAVETAGFCIAEDGQRFGL
jgi:pyrroloquinoline quinone biosynthesis protein B